MWNIDFALFILVWSCSNLLLESWLIFGILANISKILQVIMQVIMNMQLLPSEREGSKNSLLIALQLNSYMISCFYVATIYTANEIHRSSVFLKTVYNINRKLSFRSQHKKTWQTRHPQKSHRSSTKPFVLIMSFPVINDADKQLTTLLAWRLTIRYVYWLINITTRRR